MTTPTFDVSGASVIVSMTVSVRSEPITEGVRVLYSSNVADSLVGSNNDVEITTGLHVSGIEYDSAARELILNRDPADVTSWIDWLASQEGNQAILEIGSTEGDDIQILLNNELIKSSPGSIRLPMSAVSGDPAMFALASEADSFLRSMTGVFYLVIYRKIRSALQANTFFGQPSTSGTLSLKYGLVSETIVAVLGDITISINNEFRLVVKGPGISYTSNVVDAVSRTQWQSLVLTYDGTLRVFLNGQEVGMVPSVSPSLSRSDTTNDIWLGGDRADASTSFLGELSDLVIWNRVLREAGGFDPNAEDFDPNTTLTSGNEVALFHYDPTADRMMAGAFYFEEE